MSQIYSSLTSRTESVAIRIGNLFGGARTLGGNVSLEIQTKRSPKIGLSAPLAADMLTDDELSTYGLDRGNMAWASPKEAPKGFKTPL